MPNYETTFADRLQRGRDLQAAIAGFVPAFAPGQADLEPAAFAVFLIALDGKNVTVAEKEAEWRTKSPARAELVKTIKECALRAMARVKSDSKWAAQLNAVKLTYNNLRGYRAPAAPKNPPSEGEGEAARRSAITSQSYADIKNLLDRFVASLKHLEGYDTGAPEDLTIAALTALGAQLTARNEETATLEADLAAARADRTDAYDGTKGLREKMKSIKESVKSQYGFRSPQFTQVRGIRV